MNILKKLIIASAALIACASAAGAAETKAPEKVVVAYVTSWTDEIPDPSLMTHINYAFGHVNDSFNGVRVDNPDRLRSIVALKKQNPSKCLSLSADGARAVSPKWQPTLKTARLLQIPARNS